MRSKERPGTLRSRGTHYDVFPNECRKGCVSGSCVETLRYVGSEPELNTSGRSLCFWSSGKMKQCGDFHCIHFVSKPNT